MESASDVGDVDQRHQAFVVAHLVQAESLAHVAIDDDHLCVVLIPAAVARHSQSNPKPAELDAWRTQQAPSSWRSTQREAAGTQPVTTRRQPTWTPDSRPGFSPKSSIDRPRAACLVRYRRSDSDPGSD